MNDTHTHTSHTHHNISRLIAAKSPLKGSSRRRPISWGMPPRRPIADGLYIMCLCMYVCIYIYYKYIYIYTCCLRALLWSWRRTWRNSHDFRRIWRNRRTEQIDIPRQSSMYNRQMRIHVLPKVKVAAMHVEHQDMEFQDLSLQRHLFEWTGRGRGELAVTPHKKTQSSSRIDVHDDFESQKKQQRQLHSKHAAETLHNIQKAKGIGNSRKEVHQKQIEIKTTTQIMTNASLKLYSFWICWSSYIYNII